MTKLTLNDSFAKTAIGRTAIKMSVVCVLGAALIVAACGEKPKKSGKTANNGRSAYENANDHALGNPKAPITVVEYASVTCGHCANWAMSVWPEFKKKYIDTGKIRYVYREFPTPPVDLANAGHLLANCAPDDKFFNIIHVQFERQKQIFASNDIKGEYVAMAKSVGMSEDDFDQCMQNEEEMNRLQAIIEEGINDGVEGTPSFFINGKKEKVYMLEDFDKKFAEILGEPIPKTNAKEPAKDGAGETAPAQADSKKEDKGH